MKNCCLVLLSVLFYGTNGFSQIVDSTIDDPGDIAIIAYHNNPDGFSFVFLDNCPNGTSIRFIDEEWNGTAFASSTTEGEVLWTNNTGGTIDRGTVVTIENANDNLPGISASVGVAIEDDGGFSLDLTDDGIIALTGTRATPGVFLAFFGDTTDSSLTGTSLVNNETANQDASYGAGYFSGSTDCSAISVTDCAARLNTKANWTITDTYSFPSSVISEINFGVLETRVFTEEKNLKLFPTSVSTHLNITADEEFYKVAVFTTLGAQVLCDFSTDKSLQIDMSNLASGVYFVKIEFSEGSIVKKLLKK
ncbi:T9SS type A sorting domain-containing protein [Bacteroidota bacterium]